MPKLHQSEEHGIVLAFFDILGSSKRIINGQNDLVYKFYQEMIELCSKKDIAVSYGALPGANFINSGWPKNTETVLLTSLHHAFFSDTFIIWIDDDNLWGMRLGGFYEVCNEIFIEALKNSIPLRGAIARGHAVMDEDKKIYLGKPIVEAAKLETCQKWLGISLCCSCVERIYPTEIRNIIPYKAHYKPKLLENPTKETMLIDGEEQEVCVGWGGIASPAVLDWPRYWRENEKDDLLAIVRGMDTEPDFSIYYRNTIDFVQYSSAASPNPIEESAPPMVPKIVRYI